MNRPYIPALILLLAMFLSPSGARAQANIEWTKYDNTTPANSDTTSTNGKVPMGSTAGRGDLIGVYGPTMLKEGSTYKMWYAGYSVGTSYRIYYATSSNGLEWTKYDNTIPALSDVASTNGKIPLGNNTRGDDSYASYPTVIKDGSTYKMWYGGYDGTNYRIYYATSSNGLEWTKYDNTVPANADSGVASTNGKIPLGSNGSGDDFGVINPFVLKDNSTYKMWYTGLDGANWRIYHATSSNGLEWTKYNNTTPPVSDTTNSNSRIGLGTGGKGDDTHVGNPFVIKEGSTTVYKMWHGGHDGTAGWRIYYSTFQIPPPAGTIFSLK